MADLFRLDGKVAVWSAAAGASAKPWRSVWPGTAPTWRSASRNLEKLQVVADELSADAEVKTPVKAFQMDATDEASVTDGRARRSWPTWARSTSW